MRDVGEVGGEGDEEEEEEEEEEAGGEGDEENVRSFFSSLRNRLGIDENERRSVTRGAIP